MTTPKKTPLITVDEAYAAMYAFLERFNETYKSDDVSILLSGMSKLEDGRPMDNAYAIEWDESVEKARKGEVDLKMRLE